MAGNARALAALTPVPLQHIFAGCIKPTEQTSAPLSSDDRGNAATQVVKRYQAIGKIDATVGRRWALRAAALFAIPAKSGTMATAQKAQ